MKNDNDMIVETLSGSKHAFFAIATMLRVVKGTAYESSTGNVLGYMRMNGYIKRTQDSGMIELTDKGRASGLFYVEKDRVFLSGAGFVFFLKALVNGKIWGKRASE